MGTVTKQRYRKLDADLELETNKPKLSVARTTWEKKPLSDSEVVTACSVSWLDFSF